jgi:subtilisin family serine protease
MKKLICFLLPIVTSLFIAFNVSAQPETKENSKSNENLRVIAKFDEKIIPGNTLITKTENIKSESIRKLLERFNVLELQVVFRNRYNNDGKLKKPMTDKSRNKIYLGGWQEILLADISKAAELVDLLKKEEGILEAYIEKPFFLKPCIAPDDTEYGNQWHLNSIAHSDADIDAELAWNINTGRNDVIIAVCDGGVDYTHPDLDPGDRSRVIAGYDSGDNDNDPMDDLPNNIEGSYAGHGTNVAGVIGAITNNGNQVAGVMWNCKIMPVKMVGTGRLEITYPFGSYNWDFSTTAFPSDVADAIDYAVNNGAHVINLSYGFADMGWPINEVILRVPLLYDAISNAYANNVVTVVAMGNEFEDGNPTNYPAAFAHEVIGVGATNLYSQRAGFSNTGLHINVSAPGIGIWTTERAGNTDNPSGTSFSAPIVSGVAGLIISQGLDRNFNLTNDDVRHILEITADDIELYGVGFDEETGHGKVNAHSALALLDEPNELYHNISYGGSTTKTNLSQWIYIGNRWGLSAGTYFDVDRYEVTRHIEFDVPFCFVPEIWIRDRECISMSFANPNDGFPWAEITNVTTTGFDVRYSTYYVRKNILGQTINKWVPSSISSTKIAYTAIGEPNIAGTAGPITGPSIVCSSNSTFILHDRPPETTVEWTESTNLAYVSGEDTDNYTVKAHPYAAGGGPGWVEATIYSACGDVTIRKDIDLVGTPYINPGTIQFTCAEGEGYFCTNALGNEFSFSYSYDYNYFNVKLTNLSETQTLCQFTINGPEGDMDICFPTPPAGTYKFWIRGNNDCGTGNWSKTAVDYVVCGLGGLDIFPNPTTGETTISIVSSSDKTSILNDDEEWRLEVYTQSKLLKLTKRNIKGNKYIINTSGWQTGFYFVQVYYKDKILTETLIVNE